MTYNVIVQYMYAQCYKQVNEYVLLYYVVDYCKDQSKMYLVYQKTTKILNTDLHRTTIFWKIFCQLKDGSNLWEDLLDLKETHPVQIN